MVYVVILASGTGSRMGNTTLPKQFLKIGSKPIVIHTIEQFNLVSKINKIIVVVSPDWKNHLEDILKKYNLENVDITIGGKDRNESIVNGCAYIKEKYGVNDNDIVLTHDAVRPFVTTRIIEENIEKINDYDAIDTIIPATDTIVETSSDLIENIPLRSKMFQGQTPQTFKLVELINALTTLSIDEKSMLTDACKIYIFKNKKIGYVIGENYNFKITTQFDLNVANKIVKGDIKL